MVHHWRLQRMVRRAMTPITTSRASLTPAEEQRIKAESKFFDGIYSNALQTELTFRTADLTDMEEFFSHLVADSKGTRILSIGGGIDHTAVYLANAGAHVCSTDVSEIACERTRSLASRYRL